MPASPKKRRGLKDPTESSFNKIFYDYKRAARKRNREFLLTKAQFKRLTKQPCYYCGQQPTRAYKRSKAREPFTYNGIDKIDPTGHYVLENCVTACWDCNNAKGSSPLPEFLAWLGRATSHLLTKLPPPKRKRSK